MCRTSHNLHVLPERKHWISRRELADLISGALLIVSVLFALTGCAVARHDNSLTEHYEQYDKPLLSPGAQFAALPPAVQNTVRAETGSAEIDNVVKDTNSGRLVYRVSFQNREGFSPLNIAPDGSLLDRDLAVALGAPQDKSNVITGGPVGGVTLNDLPKEVVKTIQRQAADSEIDTIIKDVHGDKTTYSVTFKDRMHAPLHLASDGSVL
jgi:hypothetical protein